MRVTSRKCVISNFDFATCFTSTNLGGSMQGLSEPTPPCLTEIPYRHFGVLVLLSRVPYPWVPKRVVMSCLNSMICKTYANRLQTDISQHSQHSKLCNIDQKLESKCKGPPKIDEPIISYNISYLDHNIIIWYHQKLHNGMKESLQSRYLPTPSPDLPPKVPQFTWHTAARSTSRLSRQVLPLKSLPSVVNPLINKHQID